MLSLRIAAIGRDKDTPTAKLAADYVARAQDLARPLGIKAVDILAADPPKSLAGKERQAREASALSDMALPGGEILLLDERGKDLSSREWASLLESRRDAGASALTVMIGGADGFSSDIEEKLRPRPIRRIRFGRATWPHLMVRAMAAEQIYRGLTILARHPYHRD